MEQLRTAGLKAKLSKCEFLKNKIRFLGYMVDASGIHTQADKTEAVTKFRRLKTVENVRSFYCETFQNRIPTKPTPEKGSTFHWDAPLQRSFADLKRARIIAPVVQFPYYEEPFTV